MKKFEDALKDFNTAIKISPGKGLGFIGKADCLRFMNKYDDAIDLYS